MKDILTYFFQNLNARATERKRSGDERPKEQANPRTKNRPELETDEAKGQRNWNTDTFERQKIWLRMSAIKHARL